MYRYMVRNKRNKLTILANGFTEIASIMELWKSEKEWGNIECPSITKGEAHFISELSKQAVTIEAFNV